MDPREALARDHEDALGLLRRLGVDRTQKILAAAQRDLERRLNEAVRGPGADSFTAAQMRTALQQVRAATAHVQRGVRDVLLDGAGVASEKAGENLVRYLEDANRAFTGVVRPLGLDLAAMVDAASSGVKASTLRRLASSGEPVEGADDEPHRAKLGILDRYGLATVGHFEEILQRGLVSRAPWEDVKDQLTEASPFLKAAPRYWAERIVRTESHSIYNRAGWEGIREADEQLGDMLKILTATFDERTASDSYAVHGQIRRPEEPFQSWFGLYQHPPNRPNDREVVVPHRMSWPIPAYLMPKTDGEVLARWHHEGRKGSPPPRPRMSTVPLDQIGKEQERAAPAPEEIPAERFAFRPAPPVPRPRGFEFTMPDRAANRARVEKLAARDAKLFPPKWEGNVLDDPSASLEVDARKRMKRGKSGDDRKYNVVVPFEPVADATNVDAPLYNSGKMGNSRKETVKHAVVERVALDDVVNREGIRHAYRSEMENNVRELVANRGTYPDPAGDDDYSIHGKPLFYRYGEKLYPSSPYELDRAGAAKFLGMKSIDAHVIDLNDQLDAKAKESQAAIDKRMEPRLRVEDREAKRKKAAVEERVRKEHEGDPDVVEVRVKHQPAAYEKEYAAKYGEAAASLGWGRAMLERGLDMPAYAMKEIAGHFGPEHPLNGLAELATAKLAKGGTLRQLVGPGSTETDKTQVRLKKAAAIFAHVDAIQPWEKFSLGTHDDAIGSRERTQQKMDLLAALTDRSVTPPTVVNIGKAEKSADGSSRADCSTMGVRAWQGRAVDIRLSPYEAASTVAHELGHAIEATDRSRGVRASAFLDARTAGDAKESLRELTNHNYREDEVAKPDAFADVYVGRDYGREKEFDGHDQYFGPKEKRESADPTKHDPETKTTHAATEVTSMAVQHLSDNNWANTEHFVKDPEHFLFGLGQLGGY